MRIVVRGTGSIGMRHISALRSIGDVRVTAVPNRPERVPQLQALGIEAVSTLDEALQDSPAGVVIATDSAQHAADVEQCLPCCPVLAEKPMCVSGLQAERLLTAAQRFGHSLHVACCLRFDDGLAWAHERISAIGVSHFLDIECLSWLPSWRPQRDLLSSYSARPGEGGVLLDLIHEIDSCFWFAGTWRSVLAQTSNRGLVGLPESVEETAVLVGHHASGLDSNVRLSYAIRQPTRRLRLWGSEGAIEWDGIKRKARRWDLHGAELETFSWQGPDHMYRAQMRAWLDSLKGGHSPRLVGAADGAHAVAVCDAARRSALNERREDVRWANV